MTGKQVFMFADAARIIIALGSLGEQFVGITDPRFNGEYAAASMGGAFADGLAASVRGANIGFLIRIDSAWRVQRNELRDAFFDEVMTKERYSKAVNKLRKNTDNTLLRFRDDFRGADIISWTIAIVEMLEFTTGFGPPEEGEDFRNGSDRFALARGQLIAGAPSLDWQGSASDAYADQIAHMQVPAARMAELDLDLAALIEDQSGWNTHMRLGLATLKDLLSVALALEMAMSFQLPVPAGVAAAKNFAFTVAAIGISVAGGMIDTLCTFSILNADQADKLTVRYRQVIETLRAQDRFSQSSAPAMAASLLPEI